MPVAPDRAAQATQTGNNGIGSNDIGSSGTDNSDKGSRTIFKKNRVGQAGASRSTNLGGVLISYNANQS